MQNKIARVLQVPGVSLWFLRATAALPPRPGGSTTCSPFPLCTHTGRSKDNSFTRTHYGPKAEPVERTQRAGNRIPRAPGTFGPRGRKRSEELAMFSPPVVHPSSATGGKPKELRPLNQGSVSFPRGGAEALSVPSVPPFRILLTYAVSAWFRFKSPLVSTSRNRTKASFYFGCIYFLS